MRMKSRKNSHRRIKSKTKSKTNRTSNLSPLHHNRGTRRKTRYFLPPYSSQHPLLVHPPGFFGGGKHKNKTVKHSNGNRQLNTTKTTKKFTHTKRVSK